MNGKDAEPCAVVRNADNMAAHEIESNDPDPINRQYRGVRVEIGGRLKNVSDAFAPSP